MNNNPKQPARGRPVEVTYRDGEKVTGYFVGTGDDYITLELENGEIKQFILAYESIGGSTRFTDVKG